MGAALLPTLVLNHETARYNLHGRSAGFAERHGSAGGLPDRRRQAGGGDPSKPGASRAGQPAERARPPKPARRRLHPLAELEPGLRADEIIGSEVRSSDDKIVGEVRNIVFATKDRRDYAIVAAGGFFTPGKDSIVVPIRSLRVSQKRDSFFLPLLEAQVKTVPLMPDQDYKWLSDHAWRTRNDALFARP
jgi:hypothetical protein